MYYPYVQKPLERTSRLITVVGHGEATVKPDRATIQLEINTQSDQLQQAQQENAAITNQVIQALYGLGIPEEQIQTVFYSISPRYDFIEGRQVFRGYEVTNAIAVTLTDIGQVGAVIDTAVANGANRVSNVQFSVQNTDAPKQESIVNALQNAQMKARTIAETLRLQIDLQPVKVMEVENSVPSPQFKALAMSDTGTPIEGGLIKVQSTMRVQYGY